MKTAAIVRPGKAFGDAIWASSVAYGLKREGYHVTAYLASEGEVVLRHDPNIDRVVCVDLANVPQHERQALWEAERTRYDRWINLTQAVEGTLLPGPLQPSYDWPDELRRKEFGRNYVEFLHAVAGVPYDLQQRFYPTDAERAWASKERSRYHGRVLVLANGGSTRPKWWPHAPAFAEILAKLGIHVVVLGDVKKGLVYWPNPLVHVLGVWTWSIRESLAFAQLADGVVGQETAILNALAIEAIPKVVMLTHSTAENLTRDWKAVRALAGDVSCYPCHRIHHDHRCCPQDDVTKAAACQAAIGVERVLEALAGLGFITSADRALLAAAAINAYVLG